MRKVLLGMLVAAAVFGSAGRAGAQSLTAQDLVDIQQLYARYNWTLDSGDSEGYASTFTPDGVFNTNVGHDAIKKFAEGFHTGVGSHLRHWNTNLLILPSAGGATGQVYLVLVDFATKPASIFTSASYADELVKTPQGWRFKKRATKGDAAPAPAPAAK